MKTHPVADLFPMLADDELAELAEDIKRRGLLQPIVLDTEGRVLDGRNRLAACELAGVEPTFRTYEGGDPDGTAWSFNAKRRNLTKAQLAVLAVDRFADKDLSTREIASEAGVSQPMIVWALAVRRYQDLHDNVLLRGGSLSDSYGVAQQRDEIETERQAQLARLRTAAQDLLSLVEDDRMHLDDAVAALDAREEKARKDKAFADRTKDLPADLAERVNAGTLGIDEAESVVKQRAERLAIWAEKVSAAIETLARMAGNPVPADLKAHLDEQQIADLDAILGVLKPLESIDV